MDPETPPAAPVTPLETPQTPPVATPESFAAQAPLAAMRAKMDDYELPPTGAVNVEPSEVSVAATPEPQRPATPRAPDGKFERRHPDALAEMAADLGFSSAEIQALPTGDLAREVRGAQRQLIQFQHDQAARQQIQQPAAAPKQPTPDEELPLNLGIHPTTGQPLTENDYGGNLIGLVKQLRDEILTLKREQGGLKAQHARQVEASANQQMDAFFNQNAALFGQGNLEDFDQRNPQHSAILARRKAFHAVAKTLFRGSVPAACQAAMKTLYGTPQQEPQRQVAAAPPVQASQSYPVDQWNASALPAAQATVPSRMAPGREAAIAKLDELRRTHAVAEENQDFSGHFLPAPKS